MPARLSQSKARRWLLSEASFPKGFVPKGMDNSHGCFLPWGVTAWEAPSLVPGHCPSPHTPRPGPAPQTADLEVLRKIKSVQSGAWKQAAVSGSNKAGVTPREAACPCSEFSSTEGNGKQERGVSWHGWGWELQLSGFIWAIALP